MITCIANNIDFLHKNFFHAPQCMEKLKQNLDKRYCIDVRIFIHADTLFGELYDHIQFGRDYDPKIFKDRILKLLDNQYIPDKFMIATLFTIADTRYYDVYVDFGGFDEYTMRFLFLNSYSECITHFYKQCTIEYGGNNVIAIFINETREFNEESRPYKYRRPYIHEIYQQMLLEDNPKKSIDDEYMVSYNVYVERR